ncbi:hypothetical protein GOODEAATRI_031444 [Goodea atripinnis]|uniref:Uncharacterized protein n=1 Tax=Goodea atripinnis TaxID=208336 RepID=A0ABV0PIR5_9TELE
MVNELQIENAALHKRIEQLQSQMEGLQLRIRFGLERFAGSDDEIRFYTSHYKNIAAVEGDVWMKQWRSWVSLGVTKSEEISSRVQQKARCRLLEKAQEDPGEYSPDTELSRPHYQRVKLE